MVRSPITCTYNLVNQLGLVSPALLGNNKLKIYTKNLEVKYKNWVLASSYTNSSGR